ncbi:MAG: excisionase [Solobacterium sp.]|nr:excisionase [Solobacterium sp.]
MSKIEKVPLWEKYVLTVFEAAEYFNIGEKKIRFLINEHLRDNTFVLVNGTKTLIIRKKFEEFLDKVTEI